MRDCRLFISLFCTTLAMLSLSWPRTWPIAAVMALMFYGFYRRLYLDLLEWFSFILAVLAFAMLISAFNPFGTILLFLVSLSGCVVFVGWEGAVLVGDGWRAWRRWREHREVATVTEEK